MTQYYRGPDTVLHVHDSPAEVLRKLRAIPSRDGSLTILRTPGTLAYAGAGHHLAHPLLVYAEMVEIDEPRARVPNGPCLEASFMRQQRKRTVRPPAKSRPPSTRAVRRRLARDLGKVVSYVATGKGETKSVGGVDFPAFVSELIEGVFEAVVESSIRQMKAYAELLGDAAKAVDDFSGGAVSAKRAEARLRAKHPDLGKGDMAKPAHRQQLVATMVLMGINRIVVTEGSVSRSVDFNVSRPRRRPKPKRAPARRHSRSDA